MLAGCLESLAGQVDRVVVVDGAYAQFPHGAPFSTDATEEIVRCYGADWVPCPRDGDDGHPRAWETQMEKRSAYLVGDVGDWYFRIDADERLVGNLPAEDELEDGVTYAMRVRWAGQSMRPWTTCLFQHRGRMRYEGAHCALWSDDQLISRVGEARKLAGVSLLHLKNFRTLERVSAKRAYYAWQWPAEREFRERWRI